MEVLRKHSPKVKVNIFRGFCTILVQMNTGWTRDGHWPIAAVDVRRGCVGVGSRNGASSCSCASHTAAPRHCKAQSRARPHSARHVGNSAAPHFAGVLERVWSTLGGFIRTQAVVSLIDAVLIGIGLVIVGVPLAYALAIITFIGGFVPIVGAFVAGGLSVLIALVSNGPVDALIVLGIILAVQQFEGNVLQPWLQSKSMNLHAVIVLLAVTLGASTFGVIGAFLAVPVAAAVVEAIRYYGEQVAEQAGEDDEPEPDDDSEESEPAGEDDAAEVP